MAAAVRRRRQLAALRWPGGQTAGLSQCTGAPRHDSVCFVGTARSCTRSRHMPSLHTALFAHSSVRESPPAVLRAAPSSSRPCQVPDRKRLLDPIAFLAHVQARPGRRAAWRFDRTISRGRTEPVLNLPTDEHGKRHIRFGHRCATILAWSIRGGVILPPGPRRPSQLAGPRPRSARCATRAGPTPRTPARA